MAWQPSGENLKTLAQCLKDSLSAFNKAAQKQAEIMLNQAKASPDINNYLALIISSSEPPQVFPATAADWHLVRCAAALMLKNNIKNNYDKIPEQSLALVKMAVPLGLQDKNSQIRSHAGTLATELINKGGIYGWPEFLPELLKTLTNESGQVTPEAQEGAMAAMAKICEDNAKMLEREHNGQRPINFLLPKLIQATRSTVPKVRAHALTAINVFTPRKSQAMLNSIDDLLQHLFALAEDPSIDVRKQVCRAFVNLVETRPDKLLPHIEGLAKYIIAQQKGDDEDLATEAAEFWLTVGEHDNLWQALEPYITDIIPVLLECMVYSPEDIAILGGASDDEHEEDREEDIKPQFAKKKLTRAANGNTAADMAKNGNAFEKVASMEEDDGDLEDGEIDDSESEGDENPDEKWTLRKCSAAALDVFARDFGGPVFTSILPYLQSNLKHADWSYREAAVLALGAVADGCMDVVVPHLPELVPYLVSLLDDEEPVVRQITCWTLGRYSAWAVGLTDPAEKERYFLPMMDGILKKMLDKNKNVQEAGASAMANLEEKAGKALEPYCGPIIQQYIRCFGKYKDKNMWVLYDCVQTLAEHIGPVLARPELSNQLMPVLLDRWQKVGDESRELFPLLECLSYVAMALGDAFTPYAEPIFARCIRIIHQNLEQAMKAKTNTDLDQPDEDFLVTSLDLLSAIIQALDNDKASKLVANAQPTFFELMALCMGDQSDAVQQSAYALLGDCAKYVFEQLKPFLPNIMPVVIKRLDMDTILDEEVDNSFSVVNNACWSVGEIALQYKAGMAPFVPQLLQRCVDILSNPRVPGGVSENAAIALGRLGLDNAELVAPHLGNFAEEFLDTMDDVDPSEEKATALRGFTEMVTRNPQAMESVLLHYFSTIANYQELSLQKPVLSELHEAFQNIINVYKQIIPGFANFLMQMEAKDLELLQRLFAL
ncbi:armadillo-type protein [Neurospora tetraspora]|uniref:Armadillo-type protein n=1 Tax=Neurospora tetraspora TaxID=94610 RepID=A0AAE0JK58_9PEZI|nr:armadillo-type protein [Neurospora tetraspora]